MNVYGHARTSDFFSERLFALADAQLLSSDPMVITAQPPPHQDPLPTEVLSERGRAERGPLDNSSDLILFRSVLMALDLLGKQGAAWPHLPHVGPCRPGPSFVAKFAFFSHATTASSR